MKREKSLIKNILILGFGTIFPKIASLLILPIITAILTKKEYGTYDLITSMVSLFLPVATLQMQAAAFRYLIKNDHKKYKDEEVITNIFFFTLISSSIFIILLFLGLYKLNPILRIEIGIYYFLDILFTTLKQFSRGLSKNKIYSESVLIESITHLLGVYVFVKIINFGLNGAVLSLILSMIPGILYVSIKLKILKYIKKDLISKKIIKELISYSWPLIPNSLSSWVMSLSDRVVISYGLGITYNAIYAIANKLPHIFSLAQNSFTLAWQENASLTVEDKDSNEYYTKMFHYTYRILVGLLSLIILSTPILFKILIKGNYKASYNHIPILFMGAFFASISSYLGGIYIAHKKSKEIGISTTIAALINLTIDLLLIKKIGIYAASLSTLISYFILSIYRMKDIQKIQPINFSYKTIILGIISLSIMCILQFLQKPYLNLLNGIIGLTITYLFNKDIIKQIIKTIKKKIVK